jgi:hypothetical protein
MLWDKGFQDCASARPYSRSNIMGFFRKDRDYLTSDEQRKVFTAVGNSLKQGGAQSFSIRGSIAKTLNELGFDKRGVGSSNELNMTLLVGQACNLRNAPPEQVEEHCKTLDAKELERAIGQASSWS